jgi:hypothetical protein
VTHGRAFSTHAPGLWDNHDQTFHVWLFSAGGSAAQEKYITYSLFSFKAYTDAQNLIP